MERQDKQGNATEARYIGLHIDGATRSNWRIRKHELLHGISALVFSLYFFLSSSIFIIRYHFFRCTYTSSDRTAVQRANLGPHYAANGAIPRAALRIQVQAG